jgi:hypothetical protein
MTKVYVVRAQNYGNPESFLCGLYPTKADAEARIAVLKGDEYGFSYAWYDEVKVSPTSGDCLI